MLADPSGPPPPGPAPAEPAIPAPPRAFLRFVVWSGLVAALIAAIAAGAVQLLVDQRRASLEAAAAARAETVARARVAVLETWLDGAARIGRRLTGSELVRLFAAETARIGPNTPLPDWLVEQRRYIANQVADFVDRHELFGVAVLGLDGGALLTSSNAPPPGSRGLGALIATLPGSGRAFGPIRPIEGAGLALDVLLPIPGPEPAAPGQDAKMVAALAMTVPVDAALGRVLEPGGGVRLVQSGPAGGTTIVVADDGGPRVTAARSPVAAPPGSVALGVPVPGASWTLEVAPAAGPPEAALASHRRDLTRLAGAAGGGLLLALAALWWLHEWLHRRDLRRQAAALEEVRVTGGGAFEALAQLIPEPVAIKTQGGRYRYVNPALAGVFGLPAGAIVGRTDAEILDEAAARVLTATDRAAFDGRAVLDEPVELQLGEARRALRVFKLPLKSGAEAVVGVLVAAHDTSTEVAREDERRALLGRIEHLAGALTAPEASGWLARVQRLRRYALVVAHRLGLPAEQRAALDRAACRFRIGDLPGFEGAAEVVPAPFDPGAPAATILDVVDAFVAMTDEAPAGAMSPGQALYRLAGQPERSDVRVIAALAAVIEQETRALPAPEGGSEPPATAGRRRRERAA